MLSDQFDHFKLILFWVPECSFCKKNLTKRDRVGIFCLRGGGSPVPPSSNHNTFTFTNWRSSVQSFYWTLFFETMCRCSLVFFFRRRLLSPGDIHGPFVPKKVFFSGSFAYVTMQWVPSDFYGANGNVILEILQGCGNSIRNLILERRADKTDFVKLKFCCFLFICLFVCLLCDLWNSFSWLNELKLLFWLWDNNGFIELGETKNLLQDGTNSLVGLLWSNTLVITK